MLDRLVGIPYVEWGYDLSGAHCYGICWLYYFHVHGIDLPRYDEETIRVDHPAVVDVRAGRSPWRTVESPRVGDLGLWRRVRELHAGVLVDCDMVLHNDSKSRGSAIVRVNEVFGAGPEWFRHKALG